MQHILQLFVQILVAIQHVHSLNILHRDLKPQNIMLNKKRSVVKIGDFGISKVLSSKITSAQTVSVNYSLSVSFYISSTVISWLAHLVTYRQKYVKERRIVKRAIFGP